MLKRKAGDAVVREMITDSEIKIHSGYNPLELKRIYDGKAFNTKTAVHLATFIDSECPEYESVVEDLYQTRSGTFFLVGCGNVYSPWSFKLKDCNDYIRGYGLLPLDVADAKKWLEVRGLVDAFEEIFGLKDEEDVEQVDKECSILLRLPCTVTDRLARIADSENCSRQQLLKNIVESYFKTYKGEVA